MGRMRTVKDPGKSPGEDTGATGGEKVSRKAVSPLRDLTVKDIVGHNNDSCQERGETTT